MPNPSVSRLLDQLKASYGSRLEPYGRNFQEEHGVGFRIAGVPATFSIATDDGRFAFGRYEVQIESYPPGDAIYIAGADLEELLSLVRKIESGAWPSNEASGAWRDIRNEAFVLTTHRCPCYCDGEGFLILVACPECNTVVGRCDEVEELIPDVRNPAFNPDESICHPHVPCPVCGKAPYGQFRAATEAELEAIGLAKFEYRRYHSILP
jgi:hypothetical protein